MEVLKDRKFQLFAGISLTLILVTVIVVICIKAMANAVETGQTEILGYNIEQEIRDAASE